MKIPLRCLQFFAASLLAAVVPLWAGSITPSASQGGVSWQINASHGGGTLKVSAPDGSVMERQFASGESPSYVSPRGILPDGQYIYEVVLAPVVSAEARVQPQDSAANERSAVLPSGSKESGSFRVLNGVVMVSGDASESKQTPSPAAPEDVFTVVDIQANNTRLNFDDNSGAGNATNNWQLRANQFSGGTAEFFGIVDQGPTATGDESGSIILRLDAGAPADSLRIASSGNVGLGTAVPAMPLHIARDVNPTIRLDQTNAGIPRIWDIHGNNTTGLRFTDVTAGTTPLVLRSDTGFVGMGTTGPAGHLHVNGTGNQLSIFQSSDNNAVQFRLQTNSINRRFVALNTAGTQQSQLVFGDNGAFDFLGPTAADVRMRFLANGNVGIGTTAPTAKLSVNGSANKPGGGSWTVFSDERLKDIKGEFKGGLDEILKLQPIRYEYKADNAIGLKSEGEHIGFGAAAVQKIIPEAVTRSENGYLMIDNDPILWTMLNAIKEQNAEINLLKEQNKEIAELKTQLKRLQAEVVLNAEAKTRGQKEVASSTH